MRLGFVIVALSFLHETAALAQAPVTIHVDVARSIAPFQPIYAYFGYDEPNYTYTENGSKLIAEWASLTDARVSIRTHFLLASGDGTPALKWGSTNAYTEDASGKPVYDWTIMDRIFDTYIKARAQPFVEIGFMPQALSSKAEPYRPTWIPGAANKDYSIGWAYPPKDYGKWSELVYQWVRHSAERYGKNQAESWYWEVWNEPNISYWHGTPEDYNKLYDYAAAAVKRALPRARVGGPASTGPASTAAAAFLKQFLAHCSQGKNYLTAGIGAPLDFITYHAKGRTEIHDGHVRMGLARNLQDVEQGLKILWSYPQFRNLPVVLSESDPEGCAACAARVYPQNAYRNGPLYASYTAAAMKGILDLSSENHAHIVGMLTWAFQFEGQPYFAGFRSLASNGVDKPILNLFRMDGLMRGSRVEASSSAAIPVGSILADGVRENPDVDTLAARDDRGVSVLIWNYHDDDVAAPDSPVTLSVEGLPTTLARVLMQHYRIDSNHSNAFSAWKAMGSPPQPTVDEQRQLQAAGQLQLLDSPAWLWTHAGTVSIRFDLPREAVSLVRLDW